MQSLERGPSGRASVPHRERMEASLKDLLFLLPSHPRALSELHFMFMTQSETSYYK